MEAVNFGVLSLLPPLLAVVMAIVTKQVLLSLFVAVWVGSTMLSGWNPIVGLLGVWRNHVIAQMATPSNAAILVLIFIIGGFAGLLERGGSGWALSDALKGRVKDSRAGQLAAWLAGLAVWFSAMANSVMVGPVLRPLTDRVRVSREKLAYILDATSAQVPILIPITGWGAFVIGLIATQYTALNIGTAPFTAFVSAIPWQFYALGTLAMCGFVAVTRLDFGPMRRAEVRSEMEGKLFRDGAVFLRDEISSEIPPGSRVTVWNLIAPCLVLLGTVLAFLAWTGGYPTVGLGAAFARASTTPSLIMGFFAGSIVAGYFTWRSGIFTLPKAFEVWFHGASGMTLTNVVLVLVFAIGDVTGDVGAARFLISVADGVINPSLLPVILFLVGSAISFATGSSWGVYAIMFPLAIPLAVSIDAPMYATIGSILSSGLWGDHTSPISDTVILSSIGANCDHLDHVKTQTPYTVLVLVAATVGYAVGAFMNNAWVGLALTLGIIAGATYLLAKIAGGPVTSKGRLTL